MTYFADYLNNATSTELAELKAALAAKFPKTTVTNGVPSLTDDASEGYEVNSRWMNSLTGVEYICRDTTENAAVWVRQDNADFFGYQSGRYYHGLLGTMAAGATIGANSLRLHPVTIKERVTISELGTRVTTGESAKNLQLAIYASHATTKLPTGVPLGNTASILTTSAGVVTAAITPVTLEPGLYWMGAIGDVTTAVFQQYGGATNNISLILGGTVTQIAPGNSASIAFLSFAHTFGTFPDLTGQGFAYGQNSAFVGVFFKVQ